jgi:drug/metabolite transporter (DMT)-like permease
MHFLRRIGDRPYLLLSLTSLFWAGNAVVGRAIVHEIPPVALAQIRWTLAFLLLLPFALADIRADLAVMTRHVGILLLLSLTSIASFNTILYWSLQYTTAINATLVQSSGPLLIGLWSFLLFREPLTRRQVSGIVLSLSGVFVIVSGGSAGRLAGLELNPGDVAIVIGIAIYAVYSTLLRKRPNMTPLSFAAVTIALGALMLIPLTVVESVTGSRLAPPTPGAFAALAYIVVFPSVVAVLCYNRGVQLIGANRAGPFFHLIPLFGAILAVVFLGERPGLHHFLGAGLIIAGVVIASRKPSDDDGNRVGPERGAHLSGRMQ